MKNIINFSIFSLLLFISCDNQYNKIGTTFEMPSILPPSNLTATKGNSLDDIFISWRVNSLINEVFIYRSEEVNGEYQKIGVESNNYFFIDTEVEPAKIYYYKLKGYNFIYGESPFSTPVIGYRAGVPSDQYENDNTFENAKSILIGDENIQTRSIFPKNDIDYIKFNALVNNIYTIETLSTGKESDDNKNLRIYLYNSNFQLLRENDSSNQTIYTRKITKWLCQESGVYYIAVIALYGTGGYKIKINITNEVPTKVPYVIASYGTNSNFIKLTWAMGYGAEKYYIYRSDNDISGTYQEIQFYRINNSTQKYSWTTFLEAYDKDVLAGKHYYYKIKASNIFGDSELSIPGGGFMAELTTDIYEQDNSSDNAKIYEIGITEIEERTLYPTGDIDWIKFSTKSGYYYKIATKPKQENNAEVDTVLYLYSIDQNLLIYNDNNSYSNYSLIQYWFSDTTSDLLIKIISKDNLTGTYLLEIKESRYYF